MSGHRRGSRRLVPHRELISYGLPFVAASAAWLVVAGISGGPSPVRIIGTFVVAYAVLLGIHFAVAPRRDSNR